MKNKKLFAILTLVCFMFTFMPVAAMADGSTAAWDGVSVDTSLFGEEETEYTITTPGQLAGFAKAVNDGNTFSKKTVKLGANIDLNNQEWTPIGNSSNKFQGTFDGDNHTIFNLVITGNNNDAGLFGYTTNGEIKNLTVENAKVSGYLDVGVVAGTPYTSKYTNITVKGHVEVNGSSYVGGVGGKNVYANWTNITVNADETSYVKADSVVNGTAYRTYVGGVIGFMGEGKHTVSNVKSNIDVIGSTKDVGGITGIAHYGNTFDNCTCTADVTIDNNIGQTEIGGIAGVWHNGGADVTIKNCSYTGTLTSPGVDMTGNDGLVGSAYSATGTAELTKENNTATVTFNTAIPDSMAVANVNGTNYADLQEAIKAAAPSGTVEIIKDVTVDEWVMFAQNLTIGNDNLITLDMDGLTINGNGHTLTINSIESASNGDRLFQEAENLNIKNLTIEYANDVAGGISLQSGTIENVTFNGGTYGVLPGDGEVTIEGCTFKTNGTAIYYEEERDNLVVNNNTFELSDNINVILLRGDTEFTNNIINSGRTVNVVSGSPVVIGNDFGDVRFKVYNDAAATIENNVINTLAFEDENESAGIDSTFSNNTLSDAATALLAKVGYKATVTYTDGVEGETLFADQIVKATPGSNTPAFDGTPKRDGYTFNGWCPEVAEKVSDDVTYVAQWNRNTSSSGGGFSGVYNYPVNIGDVDGADVTLSDNYATKGETVTITVDPDMGKKVDEVIVTDADGDIIPVTKVGDNKYTFVMPAGKVNVSVTTVNADYDLRIVLQINNKNIVNNNKTITNDVSPVIVGDRTLVPVRIVTELLGGTADWDEATRTVTLTIDGKVLKLVIGEEIPGYGTGATILNDRTYVPIRYISEMLGAQVEWIANTQQIVIEK